ncbi:MAG: hypothetical protein FJ280_14505, partial [Planctomycetes bacterium]|nr:hypothetical protein [Planctomycetota bacterium]
SFPKPAEIVGHLLLPDAFRVDPMLRPKLEATASATLDQIEFLSDERRPDIRVRYRTTDGGEEHFRKDTAPFNFLYLLNGQVDMGSGDRRHLVRLIARVIRSMMVEPLSQQVRSDANNKLAEILPQRDPVNNHRQCFSSYGFWCGTPGHKRANVESRILAEMETLDGDRDLNRTGYGPEIRQRIATALKAAPGAGELIQPAVPFCWDPPGRGTSQEVVSGIIQSVRRYLETALIPAARKEGERVLNPAQPIGSVLEAAEEMIERDFFNAEQLRPTRQIGACMDAWVEGLETLVTQQQAAMAPRINTIITEILAELKQVLEALQERIPPLSWTSSDLAPLVGAALDARWSHLAESLLHEDFLGSIKTTLRIFALRKQSLEALTALAWQRRTVNERSALAEEQSQGNGAARAESLFSTPLCLSLESITALDAVTARDLRQSLLKPVLFATVVAVREVRPELADVKPVEERLTTSLTRLSGEMKRFMRDIETHSWDLFRSGFSERQATNDHPYYRSICEIWRLAEPKIDLSKSRKFAPPLDVTVVQQVANSCVPPLLTHNCEVSLREAAVDENFRHATGEWLQMLRLRYGFCLEAITRYGKYVAATDEYVRHMGFEYPDLWLDKRWYLAYQSALAQWHDRVGATKDTMERRSYEANAAKVGSLRRLLASTNDRLRQQMRRLTDPQVSIRMAELHGGTDSRIDLLLHELPLGDGHGVQQGLDRSVALMETLIRNLTECATGLTDGEQHTLREVLESCHGDLQRFRTDQLA